MTGLKRFIAFILFFAIVLAGFIFSINNSEEVTLWLGRELPAQRLGIWIILAFAAGGILGLILGAGLFRSVRDKIRIRQLEARLQKATDRRSQALQGPDKASRTAGKRTGR